MELAIFLASEPWPLPENLDLLSIIYIYIYIYISKQYEGQSSDKSSVQGLLLFGSLQYTANNILISIGDVKTTIAESDFASFDRDQNKSIRTIELIENKSNEVAVEAAASVFNISRRKVAGHVCGRKYLYMMILVCSQSPPSFSSPSLRQSFCP